MDWYILQKSSSRHVEKLAPINPVGFKGLSTSIRPCYGLLRPPFDVLPDFHVSLASPLWESLKRGYAPMQCHQTTDELFQGVSPWVPYIQTLLSSRGMIPPRHSSRLSATREALVLPGRPGYLYFGRCATLPYVAEAARALTIARPVSPKKTAEEKEEEEAGANFGWVDVIWFNDS